MKFLKQYDNDIKEIDNIKMVHTLNCFNHFLRFHNANDDEFDIVYKLFGGKCKIDTCNHIKRFCRDRYKDAYELQDTDEHKEILLDFLSKIHCHIRHPYDIGFRLYGIETV